jgi:hypothetical protein
MRDFSALYVRFGSKAENLGMSKCCPLHPRKRTSDLRVLMSTRPSTTLADFERHGIPKSVFL